MLFFALSKSTFMSRVYYIPVSKLRGHTPSCVISVLFFVGKIMLSKTVAYYIFMYHVFRSWESSVSIVSDYRLDDQVTIPGTGKHFFL
jgi:hypothetical protein